MLDYFYTQPEFIKSGLIIITEDEFNHLVHVMRKKIGDSIMIVDGRGNAYEATIVDIHKKQAEARILKKYHNHNEPEIKLTLAIGILKNPSKYDFLVEKTVEIGVYEIIPIFTERTIPKHAKTDRWQKLAIAAMKQCGRSFLPNISEPMNIKDLIESSGDYSEKILLHNLINPRHKIYTLKSILSQNLKDALILIGPEGGITDNEVELAVNNGFKIVSLGSRRLRTETAAIVISTILLV